MIPDPTDGETVIRNLGTLFRLDRKSEPVGDDIYCLSLKKQIKNWRKKKKKKNLIYLPH